MSAAIPQNVALARPSFAGVALRSKASKKVTLNDTPARRAAEPTPHSGPTLSE